MKPALLVTGAGGTIGSALLRRLARDEQWSDVRFVLTGRDPEKMAALVSELERRGHSANSYCLDMADKAGCEAFLQALPGLAPFLGLALLAGINHDDSIVQLDEESWDRVWQVNVGFHAALLRAMNGPGLLAPNARGFLTGSQVALRGNSGQVAYAAAKGALIDLMYSMPPGLRLNVLLPPLVPSPLLDNLSPAALESLFAQRLLQDPEPALSCADAGAYLLGDESKYVHHQVWHADSRVSVLGWPV